MSKTPVRVRFAPSPTGNPHVGNFRTALYNYLFARHHNGQFLLRIEDTDRERSKKEYEQAILESLQWMGLDLDENPVYQSQRIARHKEEANRLLEEGHAYRCRCTPERLNALRDQQKAAGQTPMYDGHCRDKEHPDEGTPFCIRLKTPLTGVTQIHDPIRGDVAVPNEEIDDFIIVRTDGTPVYNFAVVIDDHDMHITHVIRGDDHLNNTIKQSLLYQALQFNMPVFAHLPQILGPDKTRLSKRHGATGVMEFREQGYLPQALINYLAKLGWGHGDQEFFHKEDLVRLFTLEHCNKSSAVFDAAKLEWLNGEHIRALSLDELVAHFSDFLRIKNYLGDQTESVLSNHDLLRKIAACTQVRAKTLDEIYQKVAFLFVSGSYEFNEKESRKAFKPDAMEALKELAHFVAANKDRTLSHDEWESFFNELMEKQQIKMRPLAAAVRLALTGQKVTPPLFETFDLLGMPAMEKRLREALDYYQALN